MSNVNLTIAGRPTAISCADGEESHIEMLGRMIDERAKRVGGAQSESRTLLFAALMLADELHDAHRNAPTPPPVSAPTPPTIDEAAVERLVERVNQMAERVEKVRQALEQGPVSA